MYCENIQNSFCGIVICFIRLGSERSFDTAVQLIHLFKIRSAQRIINEGCYSHKIVALKAHSGLDIKLAIYLFLPQQQPTRSWMKSMHKFQLEAFFTLNCNTTNKCPAAQYWKRDREIASGRTVGLRTVLPITSLSGTLFSCYLHLDLVEH